MLTPLAQRAVTAVRRRGQLLVPNRVTVSPTPPPPLERPWDAFTTHAQIAEWVSHFQTQHGLVLPGGWSSMTIAQKKAWLNDNVDPTP